MSRIMITGIDRGFADPSYLLQAAHSTATGERRFSKLLLAAEYILQNPEDSDQYVRASTDGEGTSMGAEPAPSQGFLNSALYQLSEICSHLSYLPLQDPAQIFKVSQPSGRRKKTGGNNEKKKSSHPMSKKEIKDTLDTIESVVRGEWGQYRHKVPEIKKEKLMTTSDKILQTKEETANVRRSNRANKGAIYKALVFEGLLKSVTEKEELAEITNLKKDLKKNIFSATQDTTTGRKIFRRSDPEEETSWRRNEGIRTENISVSGKDESHLCEDVPRKKPFLEVEDHHPHTQIWRIVQNNHPGKLTLTLKANDPKCSISGQGTANPPQLKDGD